MADREDGTNGGPRVGVLAQYVKDLSFENPGAPNSLGARQAAPSISVEVQVASRRLSETDSEVALKFEGKAGDAEGTLFAFELSYAGVFRLAGVPEDAAARTLMVECAHLLFPFARQVVADAVRNGGFPPLFIDSIDFAGLHAANSVPRMPAPANLS